MVNEWLIYGYYMINDGSLWEYMVNESCWFRRSKVSRPIHDEPSESLKKQNHVTRLFPDAGHKGPCDVVFAIEGDAHPTHENRG